MADVLDILTLAEGRAAVGLAVGDTSQDARLPTYITAISRRLDQLCGPIVQRAVTTESCDGGMSFVDLRYEPVASITSVVEYAATTARILSQETPGSLPADGYLLESWRSTWYKGRIFRRVSGSSTYFAGGQQNVVVSYVAGRYASTTASDMLWKEAAGLTLSNIFRKEQRPVNPAFSSPELLGDMSVPGLPGYLLPYVVEQLLVDEIIPGSA